MHTKNLIPIAITFALSHLSFADETIIGSLSVTENVNVQGSDISLGTNSLDPDLPGLQTSYSEYSPSPSTPTALIDQIVSWPRGQWRWSAGQSLLMKLENGRLTLPQQVSLPITSDTVLTADIADGRYLTLSGGQSQFLSHQPDSMQWGQNAFAYIGAISIGHNSQAGSVMGVPEMSSIAIGDWATAGMPPAPVNSSLFLQTGSTWMEGLRSTAIGARSFAGSSATAIGHDSRARSAGVAIGWDAEAFGDAGTAVGPSSTAGTRAIGIGYSSGREWNPLTQTYVSSSNEDSIAIGTRAIAWNVRAIAIGTNAASRGGDSTTIGTNNFSHALAARSVLIGTNLDARHQDLIVLGSWNDSGELSELQSPTDPLFVIGNGSMNGRSNAFLIRRNGDVEVRKDLNVEDDVNIGGSAVISGQLIVKQPGGDISMGEFTYDPDQVQPE